MRIAPVIVIVLLHPLAIGGLGFARADTAAQQPSRPPASENARRIQTLVDKAAGVLEKQGKEAAFKLFRTRGSEWFQGDTYLFAYDMQLNVLLNPAFPQREGTNLAGDRDANGKAMHDEFVHVVKARGAGWVDYVFPRPGTSGPPVKKWAYVRGVTIDGRPGIIGSGFYPD